MSATFGRSVVIENIAGGNGIPASQAVARSVPDGYTVMITANTTHAGNQALLKKLPYDAVADFEPITKLGTITLALVAHPSVPANNLKELIAYAKANPGKLTFGAGSSSSRMSAELLKTMAGIDMLHVPYKSNPQVVTDLLGGQISVFFGDVSTALPPVRAGKLKGFAVSGLKRSPLAPDLPTIDESGLKGYELTAWFAAYVPAKTPMPIIEKLNAAFREALADKEVSSKLLAAGIEPETSTPDELRKFQAAETQKWDKIARDAKIEKE
jgi:tripartite-type tricarboxylate transporter receptor subunit TctC